MFNKPSGITIALGLLVFTVVSGSLLIISISGSNTLNHNSLEQIEIRNELISIGESLVDNRNKFIIELERRLESQAMIITKQDKMIELLQQQINNLEENK